MKVDYDWTYLDIKIEMHFKGLSIGKSFIKALKSIYDLYSNKP